MAQLHVVVRGVVQGVGFRWFVREQACAHGLAGWVRNQADGTVEVLATGKDDALLALRGALGSGPPGARVEAVTDAGPAAEPDTPDFRILK